MQRIAEGLILYRIETVLDGKTVPPFVTAHTFCASRDIRVSQGACPLILQYFCVAYDYVEKIDLTRAIRIQKENWG